MTNKRQRIRNVLLTVVAAVCWPGDGAAQFFSKWWEAGGAGNCVAAYQPLFAADYASSLRDLSGNGNHITNGAAPSWSFSNGWEFVAANSTWLDTGVILPRSGKFVSGTLIVQFTNHTSTAENILCGLGPNHGFAAFMIMPNRYSSLRYANSQLATSTPVSHGNLAISYRTTYKNGIEDVSQIPDTGGTVPGNRIYIGASNNSGPAYYCTSKVRAFALYDVALTSNQVYAVSRAMTNIKPIPAGTIIVIPGK